MTHLASQREKNVLKLLPSGTGILSRSANFQVADVQPGLAPWHGGLGATGPRKKVADDWRDEGHVQCVGSGTVGGLRIGLVLTDRTDRQAL